MGSSAAAHADDHGLKALFEVLHDVPGHQLQPALGAQPGLELCPLGLELFLALDFLAFRHLLELLINPGFELVRQVQLREPRFVIDGHGRPILHGPMGIVDRDVVAEHRASVAVLKLRRCAGKGDEQGVGERVPHGAGEAVDEIILAAVGFVRHHHNVPAVGQQGVPVAFLLGEELLDRGMIFTIPLILSFLAMNQPYSRDRNR